MDAHLLVAAYIQNAFFCVWNKSFSTGSDSKSLKTNYNFIRATFAMIVNTRRIDSLFIYFDWSMNFKNLSAINTLPVHAKICYKLGIV